HHVWTDGSCLNNGFPHALGGTGVWFSDGHEWNESRRLAGSFQTNQRAEIAAAVRALVVTRENLGEIHGEDAPARIVLSMDSKYVVDAMTAWVEKWRWNGYVNVNRAPDANGDLFRELDHVISGLEDWGICVKLAHIPRAQNAGTDALSRIGAIGQFF
ncbi:ribonuclease H-like domain-containing protein, partial [Blyttiomyces helicus]